MRPIKALLVVTFGVVRKTDERVSQDARESHQLRYLAIDQIQSCNSLGVVFLLFREVLLELCLLFQNELHLPFEILIAHSILSCWKIPRKCLLAYTFEVSSVERFRQQVPYSIGAYIT